MIDFKKIAIAGVAGTLAVDVVGFVLTGTFWDIPSLLAGKLQVPFALGALLHYVIGSTLTFIYAAVYPLLPGGRWARATLYASAETVLGVYLFMFPLLGAGAFGLALGPLVPVISLIRHLAFALVLGGFFPVTEAREIRSPAAV